MKFDIVRAWKDENYRQTLSEEECTMLPANPAGELELSDACLNTIHGGDGHEEHKHLLAIISNIRLFSVNVLASPFSQTCFQNQ